MTPSSIDAVARAEPPAWRRAFVSIIALTALYVGALVWIDSRHHVFAQVPRLLASLPVVVGLSLASYLVRYARWHWLLARTGQRTRSVDGFLAYVAGFAFTATPGKVGELLRIRYFAMQGVPAHHVLAAFVYERAFDLVVVLVLASLAIGRRDLFVSVSLFVVLFLGVLVLCARNASWLTTIAGAFSRRGLTMPARLMTTLRDGLVHSRVWLTVPDVALSFVLGLVAWGLTSFSFVWLLGRLQIDVPFASAVAIYPLALLAGAASMLPGGIGSTEVAIVALLALHDVPLDRAALAAIGIRLASLWFAVVCGFACVAFLEGRARLAIWRRRVGGPR